MGQAEGAAATDAHHLRQGRAGPAVVGPAVRRLHPTGAGPLQLPRVSDDVPRPDLGLRRDAQDGQARVDQVDDWAGNSDASLWTFGGMPYEFVLVPPDSQAGLWSFYPEGHHTPIEIAPPTPLPEARDVYNAIQEYICMLAESTKIPISMGDAPDNEAHLAEMLNSLHEELPHGLKRIAMKKLGLRQFEVPLDDPESPEWSEDWDLMVQDLHDMGFESKEQNVKAVASAGGDLKQAVKMLRMQEKAKQAHLATPYYE